VLLIELQLVAPLLLPLISAHKLVQMQYLAVPRVFFAIVHRSLVTKTGPQLQAAMHSLMPRVAFKKAPDCH